MKRNITKRIINAKKDNLKSYYHNEKGLIVSGDQVKGGEDFCKPEPFVGIKRFELDTKIKWVKTSILQVPEIHKQVYKEVRVLDEALIQSIKCQGIMTPLIITKNYSIISGVNRFRVASFLGIDVVPVIYSDCEEVNSEEVVGSNIQRIKAYSIIYKEYIILRKAFGISQGSRSDKTGKGNKHLKIILGVSRATLSRLIKIDRLAQSLFGDNNEKKDEIWEMVDNPQKGIPSTIKYLKRLILQRNKLNEKYEHLIVDGFAVYNSSSFELKELDAETVALHICSPPYFGAIRNYETGENQLGWEHTPDLYVENLVKHFESTKRVLKASGSLVVNLGDTSTFENQGKALTPAKFVVKMQENGWHIVSTYIWLKERVRPISYTNKPINTFEYLFHFSKSENYYFNREWLENEKDPIYNQLIFGNQPTGKVIKDLFDLREGANDGILKSLVSQNRNLKNVCESVGVEMNHTATFPIIIPSVFINLLTKEGDLVIDGFNGTGTTGAACKVLGRNYVGYELNKNYIDISLVRMNLVETKLKNAA
jgi:DNA modification methylase